MADLVELWEQRRIWRDANVVLAPDADPEAKQFLDFLDSAGGAEVMRTEGWVR